MRGKTGPSCVGVNEDGGPFCFGEIIARIPGSS